MPNDMTPCTLPAAIAPAIVIPDLPPAALERAAVEIDHARALAAMGHLAKIPERKTPAPVLRGVLVEHDGHALTLSTTDLDMIGEAFFATGAGGAPWAVVVSADALAKVLQKTKGKAESLRLEPVNGDADSDLVATVGKTRITLESLDLPSNFPRPAAALDDSAMARGGAVVSRAALADLFTRPAFAISSSETRYYLNGLFLHLPDAYGRDGAPSADSDGRFQLRAVATDGHRMGLLDSAIRLPEMAGRARSAGDGGQIVPAKAVKAFSRMLSARGAPDLALFEVVPGYCRVTLDGVSIATKEVDGTFPDYTRVVPAGDPHFAIDRAELGEAVQAVQIVHDSSGQKITVTIEETGGTAESSGSTGKAEHGFASEVIADGEEIRTAFNSAYLGDVLKAFKSSDRLEVTQASACDPARFEAAGDPLRVVVMPMRA